MDKEQTMVKATFVAALLVLLVNVVTMTANWLAYFDRARVFAAVGEVQQRVAALEEVQKQKPQLRQEKGRQK